MREILGYRLTVTRGARAGLVREYMAKQPGEACRDACRKRARRFADNLDIEYGAICASVQPIYGADTCAP